MKNDGEGWLHGWAYPYGTGYHVRNGKRPPLVVIHVPKWYGATDKRCRSDAQHVCLPRRKASKARQECLGYLPRDCWTQHERLVHVIAHELRHLWQGRVKRGHRVWGARGQFSERDADAYGIRLTRAWRRRPSCA
ncbi:hypothetical protein [Thiocapsa sp. N5-Cardenillas]|uniref:hypothetical protein n=1 Tax=Thiocapsa sp. N5-Cardenillas TaxID=3137397 RepID=UPI0035AE32EE